MENSIETIVNRHINKVKANPYHRARSWDFCFKAFESNAISSELRLQLVSYLASYGMYRGSSGLLFTNDKSLEGVIELICSKEFYHLRCKSSSEIKSSAINDIFKLKEKLAKHLKSIKYLKNGKQKAISPTDTLLSKVLLGTLGCTPAYDRFLKKGLKKLAIKQTFNKGSLKEIIDFATCNSKSIKNCQDLLQQTFGIYVPVMRVVDIYLVELEDENDKLYE
ncbi:MAG: hypothetical protein KDC92_08640 [Bacteroidetes bacterium]|nr:hypothetical protein [Bacteroidota bacterium]